jgi:hypothetical protein
LCWLTIPPSVWKNLVGVLDYLSPQKPPMEVFRTRKWLVRPHHSSSNAMDVAWYQPVGFRAAKDRLEVVGQLKSWAQIRRTQQLSGIKVSGSVDSGECARVEGGGQTALGGQHYRLSGEVLVAAGHEVNQPFGAVH